MRRRVIINIKKEENLEKKMKKKKRTFLKTQMI